MKRSYLWSAILGVYVLFIFSNSMTPSVESSAQSGFVLRMAQQALAAVGLGNVGITEHIIRKTAHFSEYALMGILLCKCLRTYDLSRIRAVDLTLIIGFIVPFADETIQLFTAGRSGQISDVWLDCAGVVFGSLLMYTILWVRKRKRGEIH